ncbi:MAG: hypothetical protein ACRYGG_01020 [Janthinobacterium lividum]
MARSVDLVFDELPTRDMWFEAMTVGLGKTKGMRSTFAGPTWRVYPCADVLAVTTVVPGWAQGWRQILADEVAYDQMTWFLHYARQYIHRAHVAKVLMFAWDRDGRVLHPFGPVSMSRTYGPQVRAETMRTMLRNAVNDARSLLGRPTAETPTRTVWASANTLDPDLHQAVFLFLRGHNLLQHSFELEAVVAFDCALQAIKTLLVRGRQATNKTTRGELCQLLGMGSAAAAIAAEGQLLRNSLGAHAGGWRWWDSGEITEELVPAMSKTVRRALGRAAAAEPMFRHVDPAPSSWSDWMLVNFDMLWTAIWFDSNYRF